MYKVSVVVPNYNNSAYLRDCITSVMAQTYRPLELVVVDDCSTDRSLDILWEMSPEIKASGVELVGLYHSKNEGCGASLDDGFKIATGDFIAYLSADDMYLDSSALETQLSAMLFDGSMWSYWDGFYQGPSKEQMHRIRPSFIPRLPQLDSLVVKHPSIMCSLLFWRNPINSSTLMIRALAYRSLGGWLASTGNADCDAALLIRYCYHELELTMVHGAPILYRIHGSQLSKDSKTMAEGTRNVRKAMLIYMRETGASRWLIVLSRFFWWLR